MTSAAAAAPAAPASLRADYEKLKERLLEISSLGGVSGLLGWDEQARSAAPVVTHLRRAPRRPRLRRGNAVTSEEHATRGIPCQLSSLHPAFQISLPRARPQTMMPKGSAELRARQSSALAGVLFEKQTAPELGALLSSLQDQLARAGPLSPPFRPLIISRCAAGASVPIHPPHASRLEAAPKALWLSNHH